MPNYNVMGVAKAGASRAAAFATSPTITARAAYAVNAISAGPVRTLAGAGISDARYMFAYQQRQLAAAAYRDAWMKSADRRFIFSPTYPRESPGEIHYVGSGLSYRLDADAR